MLNIAICQGRTINKNNKIPTIKYCGLKIFLNDLLKIVTKNIVPKGTTNPGIPFAITAKPEKI